MKFTLALLLISAPVFAETIPLAKDILACRSYTEVLMRWHGQEAIESSKLQILYRPSAEHGKIRLSTLETRASGERTSSMLFDNDDQSSLVVAMETTENTILTANHGPNVTLRIDQNPDGSAEATVSELGTGTSLVLADCTNEQVVLDQWLAILK